MTRHHTKSISHHARLAMNGQVSGSWAVIGMLAMSAVAGCAPAENDAAPPPEERAIQLASEDVSIASLGTLGTGVVITGSLQPAFQAKVKAQVPGTVGQIGVDRGSAVAQGQPLATIEAAGVRGQAAAAEANLTLARQRLESARTLRDAGALSALDFQAAQAAYEAADAQAAGAKEMAERATVRSPIAGFVSERRIEEGESVSMGDELFTVVRSDVLELAGSVPVDAASQIRRGQGVVFTLSAFPGREFKGEVARVEPVADPETRQVGVYFRMPNPGGVIGGQFATGRVQGNAKVDAVLLPDAAVRGSGADTYVWLIQGGRATKRAVALGAADLSQGMVAIASGLEPGAQVIVTPSAAIAEGARVEVGAAPAPAANAEEK